MGRYLNVGNETFKQALDSEIYVDKTGMLEIINKALGTNDKYICVSRPRRFGKSMAANMLEAYYCRTCDSAELFEELEISRSASYYKHLNKYDVIHIDVQWFRSNARNAGRDDEILSIMQNEIIKELRAEFDGCADENTSILPEVLSEINDKTGRQFIIIIDEWDCLFREDSLKTELQDRYIALLRGLFKGTMADRFVKLAYLTGILPIKKYGAESALNNFKEFTMLNPGRLAGYAGFTQDEVMELCERYNMSFDEVQRWYDGYRLKRAEHIYSPKSVVEAMTEGECCSYWTGTESYSALGKYIGMNFDGLKDSIVAMMAGESCRVNVSAFENDITSFKTRDDVITLLIHLGYLAYDAEKREAFIPNAEVREQYFSVIESSGWGKLSESISRSDELLKATWNGDCDTVAGLIDSAHEESVSILSYNNENSLSCAVSIAYYSARRYYTLMRELPSGKGFADIVFVPYRGVDKPAMIVELKWGKNADTAIKQIKEKKYINALKNYKGEVIIVGISYSRENKKHSCTIEKINI